MILCPLCQKELKDRRVLSLHLSTTHKHNFSSDLEKETLLVNTLFGCVAVKQTTEDYINEVYCVNALPIDITKFLLLSGVKRTSKQERSTDRYKKKYINSIQEKYGKGIINISQSAEVKKKKEDTVKETFGSVGAYLKEKKNQLAAGYTSYVGTAKHKDTITKIENTCIERYGHSNFGSGVAARKKSKIALKARIASLSYEERLSRTSRARAAVNHRGGFSSKPEKRVRKSLIDLDTQFSYNVHKWNYNWDMMEDNFIIEVQGTMWHAKPDRYKENDLIMGKILAKDIWAKDRRKRVKAESEGYTLIEIWEDEINKCHSDEELTTLIKERLVENGYKFCDRRSDECGVHHL